MNEKKLEYLKAWFMEYAEGFIAQPNADVENLVMKREHTLRVCRDMEMIYGDLSSEDRILALTAALLHDAGRFEQLKIHGTFSDFRSEDHAFLGAKIIRELNLLGDIDPEEASIVLSAVENHNKAKIDPGLSERAASISKYVRDADKLDIWKVVIDYYRDGREKDNPSLVHNLPPGDDVCPAVFQAIINHEIISYGIMETVPDMKVIQMGWINDLNSLKAMKLVRERGYLEEIYASLPVTERTSRIYREMKEYLENKLKGADYA